MDEKLDKLIEEYGKEYVSFCDEHISYVGKAKQAIIDYVENIRKILNIAGAGLCEIGNIEETGGIPTVEQLAKDARETLAEMKSHE